MKKFIIGFAVAVVFGLYSLAIRHNAPIIARPSSLASSSSSSSATTPASAPAGSTPPSSTNSGQSQYKDGTYTGTVADAYYGNVQVSATISGGKLTDVQFIQYPDTHSTSVMINQQAMPYLKQEAIQVQSANVQIISGATFTSQAFIQSLQSALSKA